MASNVIFIGGAPGVGKTSVSRALMYLLPGSAWVDADDLWRSHPFRIDAATKQMVEENIAFVLRGFLKAGFDHAIVNWVFHRQEIIDRILAKMAGVEFRVHSFTLDATPEALRARWAGDTRRGPITDVALTRLEQCRAMPTVHIDTTGRTVEEIAAELARRVRGEE